MHQNTPLPRINPDPMQDRFHRLLAEIERPAPPAGLFEAVMERIDWERKAASLQLRLTFFGVAIVTLTALLAWTFSAVWKAMAGSGDAQFLALAFSDTQMVLSNWSTFAASVLESMPVGQLAAFLSVFVCFILVLHALINDARQVVHRGHRAFHA
jgi:hypothetical protein